MLHTVVHEIRVNKSDTTQQSHGQIAYNTASKRTNKIRHGKHTDRADTRQEHGQIRYDMASTQTYRRLHGKHTDRSDTTRQANGQIGYNMANTRRNRMQHCKHTDISDTTRQAHGQSFRTQVLNRQRLSYSTFITGKVFLGKINIRNVVQDTVL